MKMFNQAQRIRQWGSQIDPEVTAETYLSSKDTESAAWAKENELELQQLDKDTINLYRRHRENVDFRTVEDVRAERSAAKDGQDPAGRRGNLPKRPDTVWIDRILSRRAEDFPSLMENPELAAALETLTPRQLDIVYQTFMKQQTPQEIAAKHNTTDRNVRDVLARAMTNLKRILADKSGEGHMDIVAIVLLWMTLPTFAIGWHISDWLYPRLKKSVLGRAA